VRYPFELFQYRKNLIGSQPVAERRKPSGSSVWFGASAWFGAFEKQWAYAHRSPLGMLCWFVFLAFMLVGGSRLLAIDVAMEKSSANASAIQASSDPLVLLAQRLQSKLVKIYGAGGPKGLESYQSGFIVSDDGHVVTSWSTVLDVNSIRVVTHDGRKDDAEIVGMDPETEIAVIKMTRAESSFFSLSDIDEPIVGNRVLGLSNLFGIATGDEAMSIQRGVIMAVSPLSARRGRLKTLYQGRVLVLDVMTNNPGATGGAVVNFEGNLVGMLGKELRDDQTNIWLNYAIPADVVSSSVRRILEGKTTSAARSQQLKIAPKPHRLPNLGIVMIPDVLPKTPAYVDQVIPKSIADRGGLLANDLVLLINDIRIESRRSLEETLATIDVADSFTLLVQRGQELVRLDIRP
jgi:S1-C subfamily serine protease